MAKRALWRGAFRLALAMVIGAGAAVADTAKVGVFFDSWLDSVGNPPSVGVLMRGDKVVKRYARGFAADQPVELQSTSKSITAACIKSLVDESRLTFDATLQDLLGQGGDITIAQLLTHSSGLTPDETQRPMGRWRFDPRPRWGKATKRALERKKLGPKTFAYNNENYAILGVVIGAVAGEAYDSFCARRVLKPLGIASGELSPVSGAFGPWGGWRMSAEDYARFHRSTHVRSDAGNLPRADMGGGAFYGMGMIGRASGNGFNHWHFGSLCFGDGRGNGGSYTVSWGKTWSFFAAYEACIDGNAMGALDRSLIQALFSN
ncbi:hypothetical protein ACMU_06115 [Actibacterium mucosum KCTC 23349]|uniref:Beta-lactamase-related domain-containing protein n=1 Tax=Actibacterium mucosum KCTC 23349 TaxID=1454373 RepID=A0A037ZJB0_9RHOB|nr:serine hydrolase domain-containing protein [Actibacterium mucosum]KAJ56515.1 hypothetical protein ACMU_06115 [Actibacterium mucosum KCTC 23349]